MLDEGRADIWVGAMPCPPQLLERRTHLYPAVPVSEVVLDLEQRMRRSGGSPVDSFRSAGRGAWISGDGDLVALRAFWSEGGVPEPYLSALKEGAYAEASLYGPVDSRFAPPAGSGQTDTD